MHVKVFTFSCNEATWYRKDFSRKITWFTAHSFFHCSLWGNWNIRLCWRCRWRSVVFWKNSFKYIFKVYFHIKICSPASLYALCNCEKCKYRILKQRHPTLKRCHIYVQKGYDLFLTTKTKIWVTNGLKFSGSGQF